VNTCRQDVAKAGAEAERTWSDLGVPLGHTHPHAGWRVGVEHLENELNLRCHLRVFSSQQNEGKFVLVGSALLYLKPFLETTNTN
jgi:hypothetical protein